MTIKEALKSKAENLTVSDGKLDLVLLEAGLDGTNEYSPLTNGKEVDMAYVTLLLTAIQVTEVREDDVSIKYANNLKSIVSSIYIKWGMLDPFASAKPTVKGVNLW